MAKKVAYIHGRPSGHPIHDSYAKAVDADFIPVDFILQWHSKEKPNKFRRFFSWILCALFFPNRKKYDVFFCEGVREPLLFMKFFHLIKPKQKVMALMANETLYFLSVKKYGRLAELIMKSFLRKCDVLICIGTYQAELAKQLFPTQKIHIIYNGIPFKKMESLLKIKPNLQSNKIIVIANVTSKSRMYYKGLDLCFEVFNQLMHHDSNLELHILGECSEKIIETCMEITPKEYQDKIKFHGEVNIVNYLQDVCLLLQLGRGDSYPTSSIECSMAGVPVFVSYQTGTKEIISKIDERFVTSLNSTEISTLVIQYLQLKIGEKEIISTKFKYISKEYTEEKAILNFKNIFEIA